MSEKELLNQVDCDEIVIKKPGKMGNFMWLVRGLLWGGVIGGAAVLLSTPRTGPEMRTMLRQQKDDLMDQAQVKVDQVRERANDLIQRGSQKVNEQKANLEGAVTGVKTGLRSYQSGASDHPSSGSAG